MGEFKSFEDGKKSRMPERINFFEVSLQIQFSLVQLFLLCVSWAWGGINQSRNHQLGSLFFSFSLHYCGKSSFLK